MFNVEKVMYTMSWRRAGLIFARMQLRIWKCLGVIGNILRYILWWHHSDIILGEITSQITIFSIVYSTVCSGVDQRKYQSSTSLAFVRGIHRWPVNFTHKGPVTRKMFPFDDGKGQRCTKTMVILTKITKVSWDPRESTHLQQREIMLQQESIIMTDQNWSLAILPYDQNKFTESSHMTTSLYLFVTGCKCKCISPPPPPPL